LRISDAQFKVSAGVTVIDTATGIATAVSQLPIYSSPDGIAVSPDGQTMYVSDSGKADQIITGVDSQGVGNTVSVIDTATGAVTGSVTVGNAPAGVAFSPDGTTAYVANSQDSTVSVVDVASGTATNTINVEQDLQAEDQGQQLRQPGSHDHVQAHSEKVRRDTAAAGAAKRPRHAGRVPSRALGEGGR
jgi:YVTN family beta-propeller protein